MNWPFLRLWSLLKTHYNSHTLNNLHDGNRKRGQLKPDRLVHQHLLHRYTSPYFPPKDAAEDVKGAAAARGGEGRGGGHARLARFLFFSRAAGGVRPSVEHVPGTARAHPPPTLSAGVPRH